VYSVLLAALTAFLLGFSGVLFFDAWQWGWGILFTLVLFAVIWIVLTRRLAARLQPVMARVQAQIQAGHLDAALESLESLLPLGKWMPMLKGQVLAQMGMLAWHANKKERALQLLEQASVRVADARLLLGCILYRNGDTARALQVLQVAALVNKKHALLHNTYAWILHKSERADEAQRVLAAFLKRQPNDAPTKDNMLRLQNRTRMSMQPFDLQWYALGLEQPPQSMGQMRRAPKGFREPPKGKR
jgi:tetratricopeptide (TPR) repeat protein